MTTTPKMTGTFDAIPAPLPDPRALLEMARAVRGELHVAKSAPALRGLHTIEEEKRELLADYHLRRGTGSAAAGGRRPASGIRARSGYKVVFVPFVDGRPVGTPEDVLTGFVDGDGKALGRPVGVAVDRAGALLVADDVGNVVWRVTPAR